MMELELINLISTVGFPIVAYLLLYFRFEKLVREHTSAINKLENSIIKLVTMRGSK